MVSGRRGRSCSKHQSQDCSAGRGEDCGEAAAPLQPTGDAEIPQPVGEVLTLEQVDARESCDLVGDLNGDRGPLLPEIESSCFPTRAACS